MNMEQIASPNRTVSQTIYIEAKRGENTKKRYAGPIHMTALQISMKTGAIKLLRTYNKLG